jgi:parallel beta-helix repeat protein
MEWRRTLIERLMTNKKRFYTAVSGGGLFVVLVFAIFVSHNPLSEESATLQQVRSGFLQNRMVVYFLHTYHSLRKLPDILFAPFYLTESKLSGYTIYITPDNVELLNNHLPDNPINGYLHDENRVWVNAIFISSDYKEKVQIKYRGTNANHWNSFQKSFRIKFPSEHLFKGMKSVDFIIPYDREYFAEALNFYRARKLGLETLDMSFVRINLNGVDMGVYIEVERWNEKLLSRRSSPDALTVFNADDSVNADDKNTTSSIHINSKNSDNYYFAQNTGPDSGKTYIEVFYNILENADDETFKRIAPIIIDLKKLYAFNVVSILAGSRHFDGSFGNIYLMFNPEKGKFEISPWDLGVKLIDSFDGDHRMELTDRVLSIPEFRNQRNELLKSYIENPANVADDMKFYNDLFTKTKYDFFTDNAKLYNNFQFLKQVSLFKKTFIDNFNFANAVLEYGNAYYKDNSPASIKRDPLVLTGIFSRLLEAGYSIDEFITANPSFGKLDGRTVALSQGIYYFERDIVVPAGLKVVITPGVTIYMGDGASILSYSPIISRGSVAAPVRILAASSDKPWGTFAVVNTESDKSIINHTEFKGGSGDTINGIMFTGMVAFHNADVDILNSTFQNSNENGVGGDDALNIKYGKAIIANSVFRHTFSDAIDVDFVNKETIIEDNTFSNIGYDKDAGGDAIDISWSDILIQNNIVRECADKGVSVGEGSKPLVQVNTIDGCSIGVAVKDASNAVISNNDFSNTKIGVSVYQKKPEFIDGATARVFGNTFKNVETEYKIDAFSNIYLVEQQKYLP